VISPIERTPAASGNPSCLELSKSASAACWTRSARDTNPLAHSPVVTGAKGKRKEKEHPRETKVTSVVQIGNCA